MSACPDVERIVVAQFGAAHGVRGEIRLKSFTQDPLAVRAYSPLEADDGRAFVIASARPAAGGASDMLVVRLEGVTSRDGAEALNGLELSVPRGRLPETDKDEFYHADLIGVAVATKDGRPFGTVVAVHDYGAGDLLEIAPDAGATVLVPFTRSTVPEVDVAGGRIIIDPPPGLLTSPEELD